MNEIRINRDMSVRLNGEEIIEIISNSAEWSDIQLNPEETLELVNALLRLRGLIYPDQKWTIDFGKRGSK